MPIADTIKGKWCLLVEEEPYSTEGRTLLNFGDGMLVDHDGEVDRYRVDGETVSVWLAENVELVINPPDVETRTPAADIPADAERLFGIVRTSFDDGSDDLVEYATLVRSAL